MFHLIVSGQTDYEVPLAVHGLFPGSLEDCQAECDRLNLAELAKGKGLPAEDVLRPMAVDLSRPDVSTELFGATTKGGFTAGWMSAWYHYGDVDRRGVKHGVTCAWLRVGGDPVDECNCDATVAQNGAWASFSELAEDGGR
jgi:hypothetical protein